MEIHFGSIHNEHLQKIHMLGMNGPYSSLFLSYVNLPFKISIFLF